MRVVLKFLNSSSTLMNRYLFASSRMFPIFQLLQWEHLHVKSIIINGTEIQEPYRRHIVLDPI